MFLLYSVLVLQYIFFEISATNYLLINKTSSEQSQNNRNVVFLDIIREELQKGVWSADEACNNETLAFLESAQNSSLSGIWLWDTMQLPTGVLYGSRYQLGNFDECLKSPWEANPVLRTQYCLADVQLIQSEPYNQAQFGTNSSAGQYISMRSAFSRDLTKLVWGICLPASCDPGSVANFTSILLDKSPLGRVVVDPRVTVDSCRVAGEKKDFISGIHIFFIVVIILLIIAITATVIVKGASSKYVVINVAEAFCLKRNLNSLVKESEDDIKMIHFLRVLLAIITAVAHCVLMKNSMAINNAVDLEKNPFLGYFVHTDVTITGFFLMSGLLFSKSLLSRDQNVLFVIIKRYLRLIGPFAIMVLFFGTAWKDAGDGPLWLRETSREQGYCQDNWWLSLMMLNNYIHTDRLYYFYEQCHFVSWYIPADFHLTLVCAGLYVVHRRSASLAKILFALLAAGSLVVPGVTSYYYHLQGILVSDVDKLIHYSTSKYFVKFYAKSHTHACGYLVGVLSAYILTGCKPKTKERKRSSKKLSAFLLICLITNFLGPILLGALFWNKTFGDSNLAAAAIFEAISQVYFAVVFCGCVLLPHYGIMFLGQNFFFWSAWVPLSKLSYGLYLIHPAVLLRKIYSERSPASYDIITVCTDNLGAITLAFLLSLLMYLLVEAPLANLSNLILSSRKKEASSSLKTSKANEEALPA